MKVHLNDGSPTPADANYFIVAGNGIFVHKHTGWVEAIVPVDRIDGLKCQETKAQLLLPRITSTVFAKAVLFFHAVHQRKGTESVVLLHWSAKHGWDITVPEQEATSVRVKHKMNERLPGYQCVGTMHSHCSMSAFHSPTDVGDEASQDGIHITIGHLDRFPKFGMDAEFVVNGSRFPLTHEHIVRVKKEDASASACPPRLVAHGETSLPIQRWHGDALYSMPFGILRNWTVPEEWMNRVKKIKEKQWQSFVVESADAFSDDMRELRYTNDFYYPDLNLKEDTR